MATLPVRSSATRSTQSTRAPQPTQAPAAPKDGLPNPGSVKGQPKLAQSGFTAISGDRAAQVASKSDGQVSRSVQSQRAPRNGKAGSSVRLEPPRQQYINWDTPAPRIQKKQASPEAMGAAKSESSPISSGSEARPTRLRSAVPKGKTPVAPANAPQQAPAAAAPSRAPAQTPPALTREERLQRHNDIDALQNARDEARQTTAKREKFSRKVTDRAPIRDSDFVQKYPRTAGGLAIARSPINAFKADRAARQDIQAKNTRNQLDDLVEQKWGEAASDNLAIKKQG